MNNHLIPKKVRIRKKDLPRMEAYALYRASGKATTRDERAWNASAQKAQARAWLKAFRHGL